ncbi:Sorting and assembly machinery component 50-like [Hondaea fermentalgiana]|uniref:Sorting and assembly machinery component 50-like n=1 Tax=Hondaea fermentalgiana TaxID=2315210 RepID=A0A2R5GQY7_9STRA|nr:Sorting and assembly machinery component 50-like [Hondaea fermentalgiana]|eukprot:GBG33292.1 Sorting and assembly machinery component 50-like [Hondaea fermentalgiana]
MMGHAEDAAAEAGAAGQYVGLDDPIFSVPLRIRRVNVVGLSRTRRSVIDAELAEARRGRTVREVSTGIMNALKSLKEVDSFEFVEVYCDVAANRRKKRGRPGQAELTDITVKVREKRMVQLKAETYVQGTGSEGGVETALSLNNPVGYTEKINAAWSYGTKSSASARLEVQKPRFRGLNASLDVSASHSTVSRAIYSSYDEKIQGAQAVLRHNSGRHEIGAGCFWRDVMPVRSASNQYEFAASGLILAQAKPSLKNSIFYTFTQDRRDNPFGPSRGSFLQFRTEFAGMGGDAHFAKGEVKVQQFLPLFADVISGIALGFTFQAGVLCPLATPRSASPDKLPGVGASTHICDRFWLGGPLDLRGFNHKGAGPRTSPNRPGAQGGDSLGGDATWRLGTNLTLPFPHGLLHAAGVRCHLYANAGNLCAWETSFRSLVHGMRAAVGAGIVFPTAVGRIEANYSFVLRANSRDQQKRFQLGLGVDFT